MRQETGRGDAPEEPTRDGLLTAVHARLEAAVASGDPAGIRSPEALEEADRLLDLFTAGPEGVDAETLYAVGLLHWCRAVTAGSGEEERREATRAALLLTPLYLADPATLPDPVRTWYAEALGSDEPTGEARGHAYAESLSDVGMLLVERSVRGGGEAVGRAAVAVLRLAARGLPEGHASRPLVLCNLGYALVLADIVPAIAQDPRGPLDRERMPRLEEAVSVLREAYRTTPREHPNHARCANGLALALRCKAVTTRDVPLLREAVELFRTAVETATDADDNLPQMLADLGTALMTWATAEDAPGDPGPEVVDEAVAALDRSVRLTPSGAPELPDRLDALAAALRTAYEHRHAAEDLERSVAALRRLLEVVPEGDPARPDLWARLGEALTELWRRDRSPEDRGALEEAVALLERAVAETPEDGPERARALFLLERARRLRAPLVERDGLDEATRRARERLDETTRHVFASDADRPASTGVEHLMRLVGKLIGVGDTADGSGNARALDFAAALVGFPDRTDLDEIEARAMEWLVRMFEHLPPDERAEAMAEFLADPGDPRPVGPVDTAALDEFLELNERLLREAPEGGTERLVAEFNRAALTVVRTMETLRDAPVETALAEMDALLPTLLEGIEGTVPELADRVGLPLDLAEPFVVMGNAVQSPFETFARIERSARECRARLAALEEETPAEASGNGGDADPRRLDALRELAFWLFQSYGILPDEAVFQEAVGVARRIVAAHWPPDATTMVAWGGALLSRARNPGVAGDDLGGEVPSTATTLLASHQAADAIARRDTPGALEVLEEGRAYLLSTALNTRRELEELRRADPDLAAEFVELRERSRQEGPTWPPGEEIAARNRELSREWGRLTERLRGMDGFERFLLPLPLGLDDLRPAAAEGPVVTLNVHPRRCDALALTTEGLRAVPLPGLRLAELTEQTEAFHAAVEAVASAPDGPLAGQAQRTILETLAWLWDVVAEPVLDALGLTGPPADPDGPWSRLWWAPGGALNSLPLHAAGHHDVPGASVMDRVVSSYTPTLRALLHSRARPVPERRTALAVAMPETPGHRALPRTVEEAALLAGRMPGPGPLVGPAATRAAVLEALPGAAVAHFACHASSDPADPAASRLLLHDGPLGLTDIGRLHLDGAELAYLSACGTARGGARLADEALHAASAFQLAGYAQAIATLWEIGDGFAASVAADFHRELGPALDAPDRLPGALALHTVIRRVRSALPDRPWAWASLLHAGA
ncbi:CHAT domain-containing protein [Streptomyces macrosporus]|uniref:CHAT domain-containing protein n=1 Tax=Streptomyces macrosporus TaxID=44032 RepID=A0ABN3KNJ5_9ACTN